MTRSLALAQLTLQLYAAAGTDFDDYVPGPNDEARRALAHWAEGGGPWYLCLWGQAGVGKSHLLQAALKRAAVRGSAMYVPLRDVADLGAGVLDGLDGFDALCIDDLGRIGGDREWEHALFDLFNRMQAAGRRLALAAEHLPRSPRFGLEDLVSRLRSGLIYHLRPLHDDDKATALRRMAARRGLGLPDPVASYLLRRCPRDMGELVQVITRLDAASLSTGRHLTVPFVREILGPE